MLDNVKLIHSHVIIHSNVSLVSTMYQVMNQEMEKLEIKDQSSRFPQ